MTARKVTGVVLAAGAATRFGSPKQLAKFGASTLIDTAIDALDTPSVDAVGVVLGCNSELIWTHLKERKIARPIQALHNSNWQLGLSTSIHCATKMAMEQKASHLLLLTCDQPLVSKELIENILKLLDRDTLVACKYGDTSGIPAVFPAALFRELLLLKGDRGAKSIIQNNTSVILEFPDGIYDVDQQADLERLSVPNLQSS
ncbi:MAG TPA: nucleotidyltransferase family protein [Drouetiella sp.]